MKKNKESWFDDARSITTILIVLIVGIIILSQSFAINNNLSTVEILRNIVNHNIVYLLLLVYFIGIKTYFGKKNFDYFSLILIGLYLIVSITSLLTVFQSLNLGAIVSFILNFVLFIYIVHVFLRNTRIWKDFKLSKSPFNELGNEWLFSAAIVLAVTKLAVTLIFTTSIDGAFLSFLDCIFTCLFARYIYLYRDFLDCKKIDANNDGDFDNYREKLNDFVEDNNLNDTVDAIKDFGDNVKDSVNKVLDKTDIDEKFIEAKDKIISTNDEPPKKKKSNKKKSTKKVVK